MGKYLGSLWGVLAADDLEDQRGLVLRLEGMPIGAQLVEQAA